MFSVDALTSSAGVPANENNKRRSNIDEEDHRCDAYAATRSTYDKKLATKKSRLSVHTEVVPAAINIDNVPAGSEMGGDPNGGKGSGELCVFFAVRMPLICLQPQQFFQTA